MRISVLSTVYVTVPVTATRAGVALDITADVVEWAFPARGAPPAVWTVGDWAAGSARILIGPLSTTPLAVGTYDVWLRVTDTPERLVLWCGTVEVTP